MSPVLVVAFALSGTVLWDPEHDPLGNDGTGQPVYLRDIWPRASEVNALMQYAQDPLTFRRLYADPIKDHALWNSIASSSGEVYPWPASTYIAEPPFFTDFSLQRPVLRAVRSARALAIFGDSLTTDHISPAGSIRETTPAGLYLVARGVSRPDFQSYGTRRGNHDVMVRGTFANVRIRNLMLPPSAGGGREEGGITIHLPTGDRMSIYDAAMRYLTDGTPTIVFGGEEYGTGSSRDWAAKGTRLLGVRAVIAGSFERIHRSNLVGMGVLPLQFMEDDSVRSLGIRGNEEFDILGLEDIRPQQEVTLLIRASDGGQRSVMLRSRIDTPIEADYYIHGGILPYMLRTLISAA